VARELELDPIELLRRVEIFQMLEDTQLRQVRTLLKRQHFEAGEMIFLQGDPGDCLYIIREGYVRIYLLSADGREVTFRVYGSGEAFGEFAVLDGKPRSACAVAATNLSTMVIYRADFLRLIEQNLAVLQRVVDVLTERLRYTTMFSKSLAFLSATGRVASALVALADQAPSQAGPMKLAITQSELASYAGATREWTNHALHDFAEEGLIMIQRRAITVLDRERLRLWGDA
jgi:CRP/FNR family transcriptional regulator, cyclic AMP receptor protein